MNYLVKILVIMNRNHYLYNGRRLRGPLLLRVHKIFVQQLLLISHNEQFHNMYTSTRIMRMSRARKSDGRGMWHERERQEMHTAYRSEQATSKILA
jgi:hypothetical protein